MNRNRIVSWVLALTLLLSCALSGLALPVAAETGGTLVKLEDFEGDSYWNGITKWTAKGEVTADPLDDTNKVLKLTTAVSAVYNGAKMSEIAKGKVYALSIDFYGGTGIKLQFNESGKKVYGASTMSVSAASEWKTVTYFFVTTASSVFDKYMMHLNAPVGTCIDNVTLVNLGSKGDIYNLEDGLLPGGDFEWPNTSPWNKFTSTTPVVDDPTGADNRVLQIPSTYTSTSAKFYQQILGLEANTAYELSVDVYGDQIWAYLNNAKGIATDAGWIKLSAGGNAWKTVKHTFTTGASVTNDASMFGLGLLSGNSTAGIYIDNVRIQEKVTTAEAIILDKTSLTMVLGDEPVTLTATPSPAETPFPEEVVWSSDDETVAKVANGVVTAVGVGTATITATAGTLTATCRVTVEELTTLTADTVDGGSIMFDAARVKAGTVVTVTAQPEDGYVMKPGSLKYVTAEGDEVTILNQSLTDTTFGGGTGYTFEFTVPEEDVTVTATFLPAEETSFAADTVGTSLYIAGSGECDGIRFLTRLNLATTFDPEANALRVTYGGTAYEIVEFGSLLKRYEEGVELTMDNKVWQSKTYVKGDDMLLVDYTDSYIDFTVVMMKGANLSFDAFCARRYTARGYLVLEDENGAQVTLLCDTQKTSSANDIGVPVRATLKVGTYNTRHFDLVDHDFSVIAEDILSQGLEIVGLQEIDRLTERSNGYDETQEIAKALGWDYYKFAKTIDYGGGEYGHCIVSKHPIKSFTTVALPGTGEQRALGHAVIDVNGVEINFINTHLTHESKAVQQLQLDAIADYVKNLDNFIIVGDFNQWDFTMFSPIENATLVNNEDFYVNTYPAENPTIAIDNIVVSPMFTLGRPNVLANQHSDHIMLFTDITYIVQNVVDQNFTPILRFAVTGDVHIRTTTNDLQSKERLAQLYETAYAYSELQTTYDKLDGIFFVGDNTQNGSEAEQTYFFDYLKNNTKEGTVAQTVMGNHEFYATGYYTDESFAQAPLNFMQYSGYEAVDNHLVIDGYHFLFLSMDRYNKSGSDFFSPDKLAWLKKELDIAVADTPDKPIFVFQHEAPLNTMKLSGTTMGDADLKTLLDNYPQVIDFSGHTHGTMSDPRTIWQDTFTALQTGSLCYLNVPLMGKSSWAKEIDDEGNWATGDIENAVRNGGMYYIVEVDANDTVRILTYNLFTNSLWGEPYIIDSFDPANFKYTDARKNEAVTPTFPEGAVLTAKSVSSKNLVVTIPQAEQCKDVVQSYRIEVYKDDTLVTTDYRTSFAHYGDAAPETVLSYISGLEPGAEYTVKVFATTSWSVDSEPLTLTVTISDDSGDAAADVLDVEFREDGTAVNVATGRTLATYGAPTVVYDETLGQYVASFDGVDDGYSFGGITNWYDELGTSLTMEAYVQLKKPASKYVDVFSNQQAGGFGLEYNASGNLMFYCNVGGTYAKPSAAVAEGEWVHLVGTFDGSTVKLYVNGELVAEEARAGTLQAPPYSAQFLCVGADSGVQQLTAFFGGKVASAKLYSEVLTADEIAAAYAEIAQ